MPRGKKCPAANSGGLILEVIKKKTGELNA
jgi:hypothetical protein